MSSFNLSNLGIRETLSKYPGGRLLFQGIRIIILLEIFVIGLYIMNFLFIRQRFDAWILPPIDVFHTNVWGVLLKTSTFHAMIGLSAPLILTSVGASFNERAGIINIGLEGIMLWGAWAGVFASFITGSPWIGVLMAIFFGFLNGLLHAVLTITFKAEQIVTGVAINLLAAGITSVLTALVWGTRYSPIVEKIPTLSVAGIPFFDTIFNAIPIISILDNHNALIYITWILIIPLSHILLFRTTFGLRLRVIGEHPQTAATAGVPVRQYQYIAVILSGALGGLGGATLTIGLTAQFLENVVGGRGFIALAAMIFGKWTILGSVFGSLIFSYFLSLQIKLGIQVPDFFVPDPFIQMIPYLITIFTLAGYIGNARPPKAIGRPYDPTEE